MSDWMNRTCPCGIPFNTRLTSREYCDTCVSFYNVHKYYPVPSLSDSQRAKLRDSMPQISKDDQRPKDTTLLEDGTLVYHHGTEDVNAQ